MLAVLKSVGRRQKQRPSWAQIQEKKKMNEPLEPGEAVVRGIVECPECENPIKFKSAALIDEFVTTGFSGTVPQVELKCKCGWSQIVNVSVRMEE
jgi:hypothetical protein